MARAANHRAGAPEAGVVSDRSAAAAYAHCQRLAREHYENFPVASRLLPAPMRPHIAAIYAFARTRRRLRRRAGAGGRRAAARCSTTGDGGSTQAAPGAGPAGAGRRTSRSSSRSAHTMRPCRLPVSLFDDLLSAFRQDVDARRATTPGTTCSTTAAARRTRSAGWCCASPAIATPALDAQSDAVCTALQLTNFWQDLERDWRIGRVYVPAGSRCAPARARTISRPGQHHAGVAGGAGGDGAAHARAVRRGPSGMRRRRRPAALGAAPDLARRHRASSTGSKPPASTCSRIALAERRRRPRPRLAGVTWRRGSTTVDC